MASDDLMGPDGRMGPDNKIASLRAAVDKNPKDPDADTDGDGMKDSLEVLVAGTDPTDGEDTLKGDFVESESAPENIIIKFEGKDGIDYMIQYSENLIKWYDAPSGARSGAGIHSYSNDTLNLNKKLYYRIIVL